MNAETFSPRRAGLRTGQHGISLIVVLMILLIVTVLGIGAAQITLSGERSSRADRDYQVALQSAEAALADAEMDIGGPNTSTNNRLTLFAAPTEGSGNAPALGFPDSGCNDGSTNARFRGLCRPAVGTKPVWLVAGLDTDTGNSGNTVEFGTFTGRTFQAGTSGIQPARPPRYIIEREINRRSKQCAEAECPKGALYRITAIGFGPRQEVQAVVQSVYRRE